MGVCEREICFIFQKKVRLFSQNDVLFLFYFLINSTMTTVNARCYPSMKQLEEFFMYRFYKTIKMITLD